MKKMIHPLLLALIIATLCCGCSKQTLPSPPYPLDAATVESALQEAELPWTIAEERNWSEQVTAFSLKDSEGRLISSISSQILEGKRILTLSFNPPTYDTYGLSISTSEEACEKMLEFGTLLFGGFKNKDEVVKDYQNNYDSKRSAYKTEKLLRKCNKYF